MAVIISVLVSDFPLPIQLGRVRGTKVSPPLPRDAANELKCWSAHSANCLTRESRNNVHSLAC